MRSQLPKCHVTPKIAFRKNKEITKNSPKTALVCLFVISLTCFGYSNKACMQALLNPKAYFHVLNVNFTLSAFYELLKGTLFHQLFSLCMTFGMHFDNISVLLNSVAAAYVNLATQSFTFTCLYLYTAKLEICTRLN